MSLIFCLSFRQSKKGSDRHRQLLIDLFHILPPTRHTHTSQPPPLLTNIFLTDTYHFVRDESHEIFPSFPRPPVSHLPCYSLHQNKNMVYEQFRHKNAESIIHSCWVHMSLGKQKEIASFPVMSWGKLKSLTLCGFHAALQNCCFSVARNIL